ncbi:MAG: hypothetical protein RLZZ500_1351 [Bacteroidota bacterium]|jgi:hypothetical protein
MVCSKKKKLSPANRTQFQGINENDSNYNLLKSDFCVLNRLSNINSNMPIGINKR